MQFHNLTNIFPELHLFMVLNLVKKMDHVKPVLCNKYNNYLIVNINISVTLIVLLNK